MIVPLEWAICERPRGSILQMASPFRINIGIARDFENDMMRVVVFLYIISSVSKAWSNGKLHEKAAISFD